MALRARGWFVSFEDPNVSLADARARGAADDVDGDADVIVLATPVDVAVARLSQWSADAPGGASKTAAEGRGAPPRTTSVCSVMAPLRAIASDHFVAGHPMAGTEQHGLGAASATLFEGKNWFLDRRDDLVEELVRDCGANADFVEADEHDRAVALVSHLPQVLSTALAAYLGEHESALRFAGTGLQTFLRLAGSDASVWRPVLDANAANVAPHAKAVADLAQKIIDGDRDAFERARRVWQQLSSARS